MHDVLTGPTIRQAPEFHLRLHPLVSLQNVFLIQELPTYRWKLTRNFSAPPLNFTSFLNLVPPKNNNSSQVPPKEKRVQMRRT